MAFLSRLLVATGRKSRVDTERRLPRVAIESQEPKISSHQVGT